MSSDPAHQRHNLESSLFSRVRDWTDLFGFLRLLRVLRVLSSPTLVGVVMMSYTSWMLGLWIASLLGAPFRVDAEFLAGTAVRVPNVTDVWNPSVPPALTGSIAELRLAMIGGMIWSALVWTPATLWVSRQGALLTAGRLMEPLVVVGTRTRQRLVVGWLAVAIPVFCISVILVAVAVLSWLMGVTRSLVVLELPLSFLIAILLLGVGVLSFGAVFAVPLAAASIANEEQADALDGLSRGYEAILRRPIHLVVYLGSAAMLIAAIRFFGEGIEQFALAIGHSAIVGPESQRRFELITIMVINLIHCFYFTLGLGLLGGVYLLIRQATGQQDVEDIWTPIIESPPPLPKPGPDVSVTSPDVSVTDADAEP